MSDKYLLRLVTTRGSARELGRAHGEALRSEIQSFIQGRTLALAAYAEKRGTSDVSRFHALGAKCLAVAERWDPAGAAEHRGIAEGADVDADLLYAIANLSDLRDVLLLGSASADSEGCSALILPKSHTKGGHVIAAQTWDLGPRDLDFVVAIERIPDNGPRTLSVTCAGCLTLIGMNEHGLALGTTNIKVKGSRPGVGYLSILHRMIQEVSVEAAGAVLESAPRAAAHTYWLASEDRAVEWECGPDHAISRTLGAEPLVRTNHCLAEPMTRIEGEPPTSSSLARRARVTTLLAGGIHDVASLQAIFSDRSDGLDSISRFPEDGQPTATNAVVVCLPGERKLFACRGPAQRGEFRELSFS
jgi:isopenicillin-N N-acyltransferase-like protein